MATYFRGCLGEVQVSEGDAARRTFYVEVGTAETQVVTVSKAAAAFGATAGSACTQVVGTLYKLVIDADDIDTLGEVCFKLTGSTDTQYATLHVRSYDPYREGYTSGQTTRHAAGKPVASS